MRPGKPAFTTLGLESGATRDDIARAYRRLALLTHPDVSHDPLAAEQFAALTDAYRRALAEARDRRAATPAPRLPRTQDLQFVAGPARVVAQPFRPTQEA